jgi:hypothetical protein
MQKLFKLTTLKALYFLILFVFDAQAYELDLEMTGQEYSRILKTKSLQKSGSTLHKIIEIGQKNLEWFGVINSNRPVEKQLTLYSPELIVGIPIDHPKEYNEKTVLSDYKNLLEELPASFKNILLSIDQLPTNHSFQSDDEYLEATRKVDRVYQSASRWIIMKPNLDYLAQKSIKDIRGYYFLSKTQNIEEKLSNWFSLKEEDKAQFEEWLISICHNNFIDKLSCQNELNNEIVENNVLKFFKDYLKGSQERFNEFYKIQGSRKDLKWNSSNPLTLFAPFVTPQSKTIQTWLTDNIEDEWKWKNWKLKLDFTENNFGTTHVVFTPGATPHVNGLGGNEITMDANRPLEDYSNRWTIRHEYGHTLGFPDCYVEFYDIDREIIVNYQIDLNNLMCSRRGHFQEKHYNELKENYYSH